MSLGRVFFDKKTGGGMDIHTQEHTAFVSGDEKYINGKDACTCGKQHFSTAKDGNSWVNIEIVATTKCRNG